MVPRAFIGAITPGELASYLDVIEEGLEYVGFSEIYKEPRLFIKPNLTFPTYQPGVMTTPVAIEAAILALKARGSRLLVGEADSGGYNPFPMEEVYRETGINDLAARQGVNVVNLSKFETREIEVRKGRRTLKVALPRLLTDELDGLVTMPVPKIHMNTGVSLTFKNQWGCIPQPSDRLRLHPYFKEVVVAVNRAVRTRFAIVDGTFGLNRSGPMRGDPVPLNWVLVTNDFGAGARLVCDLVGIDLRKIHHLRYAEKEGLIPASSEIVLNQPLEGFRSDESFYLHRAWTDWPGNLAFRNRGLAHLAYFSSFADPLHRLLYRVREPFYDYEKWKDQP